MMRASEVVKRHSTRIASRLRCCCHLPPQSALVRYAPVQALSGHHRDFNLGHIQPTPMFGSVVNLQPFGDAPRFGRFKFLVQRGRVVGVQVVQHQHNTVLVRVVLVHPLLDHSGPIGFDAPAHRGEAVREYLRTPELELRLVNLRATARTSTPARLSGAGRERRPLAICAWGAGRWCRACPCVGRGEGRQIPGRAVQPERRGETALPDGPVIKGRNTPARLPPRFPAPGKSTSHLGFGLEPILKTGNTRTEKGLLG